MFSSHNIILTFVFILVAFSCKKETPEKKEPIVEINYYEKHSVPFAGLEINEQAPTCNPTYNYTEAYRFLYPKVNPQNPYEFCFLRVRNQGQTEEKGDLFVYNFTNNQVRPLANQVRYGADWSVNNWIVFTKAGDYSEIWKIKPNGDSLTRLVYESSPEKPKWSTDGKHFAFYCRGCGTMKVSDESGMVKKAMGFSMTEWNWLSPKEILFYYSTGSTTDLLSFNFVNDSIRKISTIEEKNSTWTYDEQQGTMLLAGKDLYKINLKNGSKETLKPFNFLHTHSGDNFNSSPNFSNDKIISQRNSSVKLLNEDCKYSMRSEISVMNADGSNERRVVIPEY